MYEERTSFYCDTLGVDGIRFYACSKAALSLFIKLTPILRGCLETPTTICDHVPWGVRKHTYTVTPLVRCTTMTGQSGTGGVLLLGASGKKLHRPYEPGCAF